MTNPRAIHGAFTIERRFRAPVTRVFAAWSDLETKARWFVGPPDEWRLVARELDFRVGGRELLHGVLRSGKSTIFTAHYHAIVPNERLIYAYDMHAQNRHFSVSLATVEFGATRDGGTLMTFTEQAAFLDGDDGGRSREIGTAAHFDRLEPVLEDPHEIVSARCFDAARERVFEAFSDPKQLALWWGPKGFGNRFQTFELRPSGSWLLVMRGPDGQEYEMQKEFVEVAAPARIVIRHLNPPQHRFLMTMTLSDLGNRTLLTWRMRFDEAEEARAVGKIVANANEENFDRLAAHLASSVR